MQLIEEMIQYANSKSHAVELKMAEKELGVERLRVVVLKILGWLKSQHRCCKLRTLSIKHEYAWCKDVTLMMKEKGFFLDTFQIDESCMKFADEIVEDVQSELCALVDSKFSPRLMGAVNETSLTLAE